MVFTKSTRTWCPSPLRNSLKASMSSDARMASRKAADFAQRREQAVAFINHLSGAGLPSDVSEGQFQESLSDGVLLLQMLNKILAESHQETVKVVQFDSDSNQEAHAAFQSMENISNFLRRVKAMNPELKLFEASDFEKKGYGPSRTARIVDSILDLELWYSEQQRGQTLSPTSWRRQNPALPALSPLVTQTRPALVLDGNVTASSNLETNSGHARTASSEISGLARRMLTSPAALPSPKTPFAPHLQAIPATPASPFSDVVGNVLGSANPTSIDIDGIARRLEIFVETCKQEFDNLKYVKEEQMLKLKEALMDALKSDEMHQSRGRMLEALIEGQGEEVLVVSEQLQQAQEEQMRVAREKRRFKEELIRTRRELDLANQRIAELEEEGPRKSAACQEREARAHMQLLRAAGELQALKRALVDTKTEVHRSEENWRDHLRSLEGQMVELARVTQGYQKVLDENRKLYNEVQDLKGNIRVYCRVRPLHSHERTRPSCVEFTGPNGDIMVGSSVKPNSRRGFSFDKVFGPGTSQEAIFADTRPLIRSVLDGYNVCIFAYGQTGSGKTFTMAGPNNPSQTDWGVNVRALNDLFGLGSERAQTMRYEVGVQMVEIYNEQVRDLLDSTGNGPRSLEIRNSSQVDGLNVPDATKVPVCSTADVLRLMDLGMRNRAVACTSLNERSSRSHSVLTVHVYGQEVLSGAILRGCLHLVDLAGSERVDRSEATGDRLREAQHINKSLSALGDVIAALASKSAHVPYRNSKLTQLLQDALGKQAKTLMFVHVSPDEESYNETVSTLTFAKRVASVELGASSRNAESAELRESREKIANLKDELQRKAAEIERLQQLKAEAVNRANTLAAAAAPARVAPDRRLSEGGLAKRALSPEKEPEKNARVKRLGEGMSAIVEERDAPSEGRLSTGRFTRSRGLPPSIPGVRKILTRRNTGKPASHSLETPLSAGILTRAAAAAAAAERDPGAFAQSEGLEILAPSWQAEGGEPAANGHPAQPREPLAGAWSESDSSGEVLQSEGSGDEELGVGHPIGEPQQPREQSASVPEPNDSQLLQPGNGFPEKPAHRRTVSVGSAPVSESPPVSPARTPRAKDPLRASSEDFNLPLPTARPDSRLKKGESRGNVTRIEKENDEEGSTPALLPGGASPIGKGSLFEKQSGASRLRMGSLSSESASKLPTPRRLTMAGTSIPIAPGRVAIHRRSSSIEEALQVPVPTSAIPAPPSRLKQPGAAITPSGAASRQSARRQWV